MAPEKDLSVKRWSTVVGGMLVLALLAAGFLSWQQGLRMERHPLPEGASPPLREGFRPGATTSASCKVCHADIFALWHDSHHAKANRPLSADLDREAFVPARTLTSGGLKTRMDWQGGRATITTPVADESIQTFYPDMVLAYLPLQQFLIPFGGGRWQVTEWAWDPKNKDWFNVYGDDGRHPREWGSWAGRGMNWNSNCAACHMTGFSKDYSVTNDTYASRWDEMGVSCLQCHTVPQAHLTQGAAATAPDWASAQQNCASCHSRRSEEYPGFQPGAKFNDHFRLAIPDREGLYYPDGQVRDEDFEYGSFLMSKMGGHGGITCLDCHDPHSGASKFPVANNTSCLTCHQDPGQRGAPVITPTAHSHHKEGSTGNKCIECHMPLTTYMQRDPRRDHGFGIPDPLMTHELGIPNACNSCHTDKTTEWAMRWTDTWYGEKMHRPERERTRAVAQAYAGGSDPELIHELLRLYDREPIALWRATLLSLASRRVDLPEARQRLQQALADPDAIIRATAVNGLAPLPATERTELERMVADPVRLVRLSAAWALRDSLPATSKARKELLTSLEFNADQPSGAARFGQWYFSQGETAQAEVWYRKAMEWDRYSLPLYADLALMQNASRRPMAALETLTAGLAIMPTNTDLLNMKALLLAETGNAAAAGKTFVQSLEIDSNQARTWYNLGLLYAQQEELDQAVEALKRAETIDPQSADFPFARATIHLRQNNSAAAAAAAKKALKINPAMPSARQLLDGLGRQNQ